jgi:hypothetical protein
MVMKKVISMLLLVLIFAWAHVTYGRVTEEISLESVSHVIVDIQKLFRSGCVYILQASEEEMFGKMKL